MQVSFVIPSLNQGDFISRCVNSCFQQAIESSEIIVQDGGSTDSTVAVLRNLSDQLDGRGSLSWISEPDAGQSSAVNRAVTRAKGKIIAWINSDDFYTHPNVLKSVCDTFARDRSIDIVYGDGMFVSVDGTPLRRYKTPTSNNIRRTLLARPSSPFAQPAVFFKRSLFLDVGGLSENLHWAMDLELWFRMFARAQNWHRLKTVLAYLTTHQDAKSIRGIEKQIQEIKTVKLEFLRENHGSLVEYMVTYRGMAMLRGYRWLGRAKHIQQGAPPTPKKSLYQ